MLGHNGDGNNELKASHTSMDAQSFDSLHQRLYHDFLRESNAREELRADLTKKYNVLLMLMTLVEILQVKRQYESFPRRIRQR